MESIKHILDFILHFDEHLAQIVEQYGFLTYGLIFLIIFLETGVVIAPFLPGDSLLFVLGALASQNIMNIWLLYILLLAAAIGGDTLNYWIGHHLGPRVFKKENSRFLKREYLDKTEQYYKKYGGKTVILARFIPIVRTFAPFVAGVGSMTYSSFIFYNVVGGFLWVTLFLFLGYFFGTIPFIKEHFHELVLVIIVLSVVPVIIEVVKHRKEAKKKEHVTFGEIEKTFHKKHLD